VRRGPTGTRWLAPGRLTVRLEPAPHVADLHTRADAEAVRRHVTACDGLAQPARADAEVPRGLADAGERLAPQRPSSLRQLHAKRSCSAGCGRRLRAPPHPAEGLPARV